MTILASGISMYALAILMEKVLGWNFHLSLILSAAIVLAYTYLGGLSSAIYNEVLQFFIIVIGLLPIVFFKPQGSRRLDRVTGTFSADRYSKRFCG